MIEDGFGLIDPGIVPEAPFGHTRLPQSYALKTEPDVNGSVYIVHNFEPMPIAEVANMARAKVTKKRKDMEAEGITLNGMPVQTGIDDQNRITSVLLNAGRAGITEIKFKSTIGFITMTITQLEGIANVISYFVQGLFSAEGEHYAAITALETALDHQGLLNYDSESNWPSTVYNS